MPRKQAHHMYAVFILAYASSEVAVRAAHGEVITEAEALLPRLFYYGSSEKVAGYQFSRAARLAMTDRLSYAVVLERDREVLARLAVERR